MLDINARGARRVRLNNRNLIYLMHSQRPLQNFCYMGAKSKQNVFRGAGDKIEFGNHCFDIIRSSLNRKFFISAEDCVLIEKNCSYEYVKPAKKTC